jgi:hypothetical protein
MYKIGRRYEEYLVRKFKKQGIDAVRVPLSGKSNPLLPSCDIILNYEDIELKGQLKYTRTDVIVFKEKEIKQLENREIHFLSYAFYKKEPKFVLNAGKNFMPYGTKIYKDSNNLNISLRDYTADYFIYKKSLVLKNVDFNTFVDMIKNKIIKAFM